MVCKYVLLIISLNKSELISLLTVQLFKVCVPHTNNSKSVKWFQVLQCIGDY